MKLQELKAKIENNDFIKEINEVIMKDYKYNHMKLTGGAIIDILEDRKIKDYDFVECSDTAKKHFISNGFEFKCKTSTAETYVRDNLIIQFLTTKIETFDFKISSSTYCFYNKNLTIDLISFDKKILIPNNFNPKSSVNCLRRYPHFIKKGYSMPNETYQSLINCGFNKSKCSIES